MARRLQATPEMATTHERAGTLEITDAGDRLRTSKQRSPKGIGIITAMIAFFLGWAAITFFVAQFIAPEPEESTGPLHQERAQPADAVDDPRTIGD